MKLGSYRGTPPPKLINDLAAWYGAAVVKDGSDRISVWKDQSGNGNDLAQGTGGAQPLWISNSNNGLPGVQFDGATDFMSSSGTISLSVSHTIFIVTANTTKRGMLIEHSDGSGSDGSYVYALGDKAAAVRRTSGGQRDTTSLAWAPPKPSVLTASMSGTSVAVWLNGEAAPQTEAPNSPSGNATKTLYVGARAGTSLWHGGDIQEIIIYNRQLSTAERELVESYLINKYATVTSHPATLPGLTVWYDAASGITKNGSNRVSGWADQSGTGDTNENLGQATGANQPYFNAIDGSLNGHPSLTFSESRNDFLFSGTWNTPMPSTATWLVIGKITTRDTNGGVPFDGNNISYRQSLQINTTQWLLYSGSVIYSLPFSTPGTFAIASIFGTSGKSYISAKTPAATGSTGTMTLTQLIVGAGAQGAPGYYFDGQIAEIIGFNRALTQAEVEGLLDWAETKYGITITQPNTVTDIAGCVAWYDAAQGITKDGFNKVSAWADQSGCNNHLAQGTADSQPLYVSSVINGLPALDFDGTDDWLQKTSGSTINACTIFVVCYFDLLSPANGDVDYALMLGTTGTGAARSVSRLDDTDGAGNLYRYYCFRGGERINGQPLSGQQWLSITADHTGTAKTSRAWVNGVQHTVADAVFNAATTTGTITVGAYHDGAPLGFMNGKIAEIIVYNSVLSDGDRQAVQAYLDGKYGLAFAPETIGGLVAWYDASQGITKDGSNRVSAWANQITTDSNTNLVQAVDNNKPLWLATDANLNGQPSLFFNLNRADKFDSGTWAVPMTIPCTWIVVARPEALDSAGAMIIDSPSTQENTIYLTAGTAINMYSGTNISAGAHTLPKSFVIAGEFGTSAKLYVNAKTAIASGNSGTQALTKLLVGYYQGGATYDFSGTIAEILGFNRVLAQAEINSILDWAGAKYGIVIGA